MAKVANENLLMHHIDISTTFLYGDIDEEVYINELEGLQQEFNKDIVLNISYSVGILSRF